MARARAAFLKEQRLTNRNNMTQHRVSQMKTNGSYNTLVKPFCKFINLKELNLGFSINLSKMQFTSHENMKMTICLPV